VNVEIRDGNATFIGVAYRLSLRMVVPIKVVAIDANRAKFNRSFRTTTPMN